MSIRVFYRSDEDRELGSPVGTFATEADARVWVQSHLDACFRKNYCVARVLVKQVTVVEELGPIS